MPWPSIAPLLARPHTHPPRAQPHPPSLPTIACRSRCSLSPRTPPPTRAVHAGPTPTAQTHPWTDVATPTLRLPPAFGFVSPCSPSHQPRIPHPPQSTAASEPTATQPPPSQHVRSASAITLITSMNATPRNYGMASLHMHAAPQKGTSLTATGTPSAMTGKSPEAAPSPTDLPAMIAQDVASQTTALKTAIVLRQSQAITPYNPDTW